MTTLLGRQDALRALKRCLCLAKQDLVVCDYLNNSNFWRSQALGRCAVYGWLRNQIQEHGVDHAYLLALKRYQGLPLFISCPEQAGEEEGLEVFFLFIAGESPASAQINA